MIVRDQSVSANTSGAWSRFLSPGNLTGLPDSWWSAEHYSV